MSILEEKIKKVLDRHASYQINLAAEAAREFMAHELAQEIESTFGPFRVKPTQPKINDTLTMDVEDDFNH